MNDEVRAIRIADYLQYDCPHCGAKTNCFALQDDGIQKCIGCGKIFKVVI